MYVYVCRRVEAVIFNCQPATPHPVFRKVNILSAFLVVATVCVSHFLTLNSTSVPDQYQQTDTDFPTDVLVRLRNGGKATPCCDSKTCILP